MSYEIKQLLREAGKNTHMTHVEDLTVLGGIEGIDRAIGSFESLLDQFQGFTPKSKVSASLKIDGTPAVVVAINFPGINKPFVSMKGLFAKNPKYATTAEEVDQIFGYDNKGNYREDLARKLKTLLQYVPSLGIPDGEIWQGDFLYDKQSLRTRDINGEEYITFHPNTLVYVVKADSELAGNILDSEVGVAWHTVYTGSDLENAKASFTADAGILNYVPEVWSTDPYIKSLAGKITFTAEQTDAIAHLLDLAHKDRDTLASDGHYNSVIDDDSFVTLFTQFQNKIIRDGGTFARGKDFTDGFTEYGILYINEQSRKAQEKVKTEVAKQRNQEKYAAMLDDFTFKVETFVETLDTMSELIGNLTDLKTIFTKRLDSLAQFDAFLQTKDGAFSQTGQEGFAISDMDGNVVKFVDRGQFSYANFSTDVVKGWENTRLSEATSSKPSQEMLDRSAAALGKLPMSDKLIVDVDSAITTASQLCLRVPLTRFGDRAQYGRDLVTVLRSAGYEDAAFEQSGKGYYVSIPSEGLTYRLKPSGVSAAENTSRQEDIWAMSLSALLDDEALPNFTEKFPEYAAEWSNSWDEGSRECLPKLKAYNVEPIPGEFVVCSSSNVHGQGKSSVTSNVMQSIITIPTEVNKRAKKLKMDKIFELGGNRDTWNPSDMFVVRVDAYAEIESEVESMIATSLSVDSINAQFKEWLKAGDLVGISLKKLGVGVEPSCSVQNLTKDEGGIPDVTGVAKTKVRFFDMTATTFKNIDLEVCTDNHETASIGICLRNPNGDDSSKWTLEGAYLNSVAKLGKLPAKYLETKYKEIVDPTSRGCPDKQAIVDASIGEAGVNPFIEGGPLYDQGMALCEEFDTIRSAVKKDLGISIERVRGDETSTSFVDSYKDLMRTYDSQIGESITALDSLDLTWNNFEDRVTQAIEWKSTFNRKGIRGLRSTLIVLLYMKVFLASPNILQDIHDLVTTAAKMSDSAAPYIKLEGAH